jgi:hypothetical protein
MFEICLNNTDIIEEKLIAEFTRDRNKQESYETACKRVFKSVPCFHNLKCDTNNKSNYVYFTMTFRPGIDKYIEELNKIFTNANIEVISKIELHNDGQFCCYGREDMGTNKDKLVDIVDNRMIKITVDDSYNIYTKRVIIYMIAILVRLLYLGRFKNVIPEHYKLLEKGEVLDFIIERNKLTREIDSEHTPCMLKDRKGNLIELTKEMLLTLNDIDVMNGICKKLFKGKTDDKQYLTEYVRQTVIFENIIMYLKGLL